MNPNTRHHCLQFAVLLLAVVTTVSLPAQDAGLKPQTVQVAGRVVDSKSGAGVPEAVVRIAQLAPSPNPNPSPSQPPLDAVLTDSQGRFRFAMVPTGAYTVISSKDGYIDGAYGKSRHFEAAQPLTLSDNRTDLRIEVWRYGVVTGSVTTAAGEPIVAQKVAILQRQPVSGRTMFTSQVSAMTDDRGVFRSPLVAPGEYTACLPSVQTTLPSDVFSLYSTGRLVMDRHLRRQLTAIGAEPPPPGSLGIRQVGEFVVSSWAMPNSGGGVYPLTCSPSTRLLAEATVVQVISGETSPAVDIRVLPTVGYRVQGQLSGDNGPAGRTTVRLLANNSLLLRDSGFETAIAMTDSSGRFIFAGVPSGQYEVQASVMASDTSQQPQSRSGSALRWLSEPLAVGGDVNDLALRLQEGLIVKGRVVLDDAVGPVRPPMSRFVLGLEPADGRPRSLQPAAPAPDGSFSVKDVTPGRYFLRATASPPGWTLRDAMRNGRDVSDEAFDIAAGDSTEVTVAFTARPTQLDVSIVTPDAKPSLRVPTVYVVTTDKRYWVDYGWNPKRLREARSGMDGKAQFLGLPAGDYFVAAISAETVSQLRGLSETLEFVSRQGQRVQVNALQPTQVRLPISEVRR